MGAASLRLAAGVPIAAVSKELGHSSITITADTYSHLLAGSARRSAEAAMNLVPRGTGVPTSFPQVSAKDGGRLREGGNSLVGGGAPSGTRTPNPLIKSQLLCQLS